ncbi:FecR domain-containing protein [Peredibacter sp. HCB2-198]|uniref:FecR family protein n=1 Tax=Peredibacter sp. HCB2-198 TaxID=3383025 RepID=UPI0038B522C5
MKVMILIALFLMCASAFATSKVAVVKLMRGEASVLTLGKTTPLKVDDWVENGAVVKTAEKSFVKLIFIDKSSMNVGPNSEMKIESFSGKDSGVIDLVKGKIRSQVTKDYLQINKDKSKLFIKTQNAVMGVRGTDFMISTNGKNTSTVLFEGEIVFNKLEQRGETNTNRLEEIVDRGVRMYPGEFSVMEASRPMPTIPSLMNIQQRERLEKNSEFESSRTPSNTTNEVSKSVVPAGLSGAQVSNTSETIKTQMAQVVPTEPTQASPASADPDGYVKGDAFKPANGSIVNVESGEIIAPGPGSTLDKNTNTYIDGQGMAMVSSSGDVIQPSQELKPNGPTGVPNPSGGPQKPGPTPVPAPAPRPDITHSFPDFQRPLGGTCTGGGICGVNDPTRGVSTHTDTTIIIRP